MPEDVFWIEYFFLVNYLNFPFFHADTFSEELSVLICMCVNWNIYLAERSTTMHNKISIQFKCFVLFQRLSARTANGTYPSK